MSIHFKIKIQDTSWTCQKDLQKLCSWVIQTVMSCEFNPVPHSAKGSRMFPTVTMISERRIFSETELYSHKTDVSKGKIRDSGLLLTTVNYLTSLIYPGRSAVNSIHSQTTVSYISRVTVLNVSKTQIFSKVALKGSLVA